MIKVLIVDDSAVVRSILTETLSSDPEIEVVGTAPDPYIARNKILKFKPDVITLDVKMPKMDGLSFLDKIMKYHPIPVVIVSSTTKEGSINALKALEMGAIDFVSKPGNDSQSVLEMKSELITKVKSASQVKLKPSPYQNQNDEPAPVIQSNYKSKKKNLIAIGASTGGTEAIKAILYNLPTNLPGIVIVIHMPPVFTKSYADRLNQDCQLHVKEAENNDKILPGHVLIAPGDHHMVVKKLSGQYVVQLQNGPKVNHQRPAVDTLFQSVAKEAGSDAIGIILTGMGKDGAQGMLEMKNNNAYTIAQDESSCVIFGMPKEAIKNGSVDVVKHLHHIPSHLVHLLMN